MKFKGYYDENFNHLGFLTEDDERQLSDKHVIFTEEEWLKATNEMNGVFKYDSTNPQDLTKIQAYTPIIEEPDDIKQTIIEAQKEQQEHAIEKLRTMGLIKENENLKSIIWEIIPLLDLKGDEVMLIEMIANQIIFGLKTFKDVPLPLRAKVKEQLELMGCGWLAE